MNPELARNGHAALVALCPGSWGQSGKHMLAMSFSGFDPKATLRLISS
jgi:hypothetical protein